MSLIIPFSSFAFSISLLFCNFFPSSIFLFIFFPLNWSVFSDNKIIFNIWRVLHLSLYGSFQVTSSPLSSSAVLLFQRLTNSLSWSTNENIFIFIRISFFQKTNKNYFIYLFYQILFYAYIYIWKIEKINSLSLYGYMIKSSGSMILSSGGSRTVG